MMKQAYVKKDKKKFNILKCIKASKPWNEKLSPLAAPPT